MKRTVGDVMTQPVLTIEPHTPYKEIVRILRAHGVSALPVMQQGTLMGIVSEADLLLKQESQHPRASRSKQRGRAIEQMGKADGVVAYQIMSSPVITIAVDEPIGAAARTMRKHRVKRLPVVGANGELLGIVSRADVLTIFMRPDDEIRREILHDVIERKLWLTPEEARIKVGVRDGVVHLQGRIDRKSTAEIMEAMVLGVEGVVAVESGLSYEQDDSDLRPAVSEPWGVLPYALRRP